MTPRNLNLDEKSILHKGYDSFYPEPGEVDSWQCRVCGSDAIVERNVSGPTSWAEAVSRAGHDHDRFTCPNVGQAWHEQAYRLVCEAQNTASPIIESIIRQDLEKLLNANLLR